MTSQIKDTPYFNFFVDNPEQHGLQINGQMKNADTAFRYRKYCKSQTVDFRYPCPFTGAKIHFRVKDHNDLKLGFGFGTYKLGSFKADYFAKLFSKDKQLSYLFGLKRDENEKFGHSIWLSLNQGLFVNYNFVITQQKWFTRAGLQWNVGTHSWNFDGLFNYTQNLNEFFVKASNTIDGNFKCINQSASVGYLRRRGNDKACGFLLDKNLNFELLCHAKVKTHDARISINQAFEIKHSLRFKVNDKLNVVTGLKVPLTTIGKACPLSYLTALQLEMNI